MRRVLEIFRVRRMDAAGKDAEILVLAISSPPLLRQVARPRLTWSNRALITLFADLITARALGIVPRQAADDPRLAPLFGT